MALMEQLIEQHQGKIIQQAIKKAGFRMQMVAQRLGMARNTLYITLKKASLEDWFIIHVGNIIHYDFTKVFPEVYQRVDAKISDYRQEIDLNKSLVSHIADDAPTCDHPYQNAYLIQLETLREKYIKLMEDYYKLLRILTLLANSSQVAGLKREIMELIENEEED